MARNISRADTGGLNAYVKWQAAENTAFDLRYLYADKRPHDGGEIFKYGINYLRHMVDLGMDRVFSFGRNRVDIVMKKKPDRRAWTLVNDRFSINVKKDWEVFFEVYNLGNVEFQEIEGIPEQGRLFKAGLKVTW